MLSERDLQILETVESPLSILILDASRIVPFKVIEGHRGREAQEKAFKEGKTKLHWPAGKHNSMPSMAVDLAPLYYENGAKIDWNDLVAFGRIMGVIQALAFQGGMPIRFGLDWDGDFRTAGRDPDEKFLDAPHVELIIRETNT